MSTWVLSKFSCVMLIWIRMNMQLCNVQMHTYLWFQALHFHKQPQQIYFFPMSISIICSNSVSNNALVAILFCSFVYFSDFPSECSVSPEYKTWIRNHCTFVKISNLQDTNEHNYRLSPSPYFMFWQTMHWE